MQEVEAESNDISSDEEDSTPINRTQETIKSYFVRRRHNQKIKRRVASRDFFDNNENPNSNRSENY